MLDFSNIPIDKYSLAWTGLTPKEIDAVLKTGFNPLGERTVQEIENPGLRELFLLSKCPEYIYFAGKLLLNRELTPMQCCILYMMWTHPFPMLIASRGASKSSLLAYYSVLRAALMQGSKIVCVGASFRQSKILHGYAEERFLNSPVLRSIFKKSTDGTKNSNDMITLRLGDSTITYLPIGSGDKIRGLRGNIIIADEMDSLATDVYEVVINNFASVAMNPIDQMKRKAKIRLLSKEGLNIPDELLEEGFSNQSIISGTMGYTFNPMYSYWQKYKKIIDSGGESLEDAFDEEFDLNYKDFCIMRIPYELIPEGFMDDKTIARAKATINIDSYNSEYGCVPISDTTGFFRRALIESCVSSQKNVGSEGWPDYCPNIFDVKIKGSPNSVYVMGVDPASESDNFAIVILEVFEDHQRLVYCWTTNRETVQKQDSSINYWSYCARKIRDLTKKFDIEIIGIDSQGGGISLSEALHDKEHLQKGEKQFWPVIEPGKRQETDKMAGEHNLKMINFSNYNWLSNANFSLKKDFESKGILFPRYDVITLGLAGDANTGNSELESCIIDIEELKDELATIVMTSTSNRFKWDTPESNKGKNKVGKLRKDRYSALLIGNDMARSVNRFVEKEEVFSGDGLLAGSSGNRNRFNPGDFYACDDPNALKSFNPSKLGYGVVQR